MLAFCRAPRGYSANGAVTLRSRATRSSCATRLETISISAASSSTVSLVHGAISLSPIASADTGWCRCTQPSTGSRPTKRSRSLQAPQVQRLLYCLHRPSRQPQLISGSSRYTSRGPAFRCRRTFILNSDPRLRSTAIVMRTAERPSTSTALTLMARRRRARCPGRRSRRSGRGGTRHLPGHCTAMVLPTVTFSSSKVKRPPMQRPQCSRTTVSSRRRAGLDNHASRTGHL